MNADKGWIRADSSSFAGRREAFPPFQFYLNGGNSKYRLHPSLSAFIGVHLRASLLQNFDHVCAVASIVIAPKGRSS
jgi:hypothetical protein